MKGDIYFIFYKLTLGIAVLGEPFFLSIRLRMRSRFSPSAFASWGVAAYAVYAPPRKKSVTVNTAILLVIRFIKTCPVYQRCHRIIIFSPKIYRQMDMTLKNIQPRHLTAGCPSGQSLLYQYRTSFVRNLHSTYLFVSSHYIHSFIGTTYDLLNHIRVGSRGYLLFCS